MSVACIGPFEFCPGQRVVSLVSHPPEVQPGTAAVIVSPYIDDLYAVVLPNGEPHRWLARFELSPACTAVPGALRPGDIATVISAQGHGPHIQVGMRVRILKALPQAVFYDVMLEGRMYHRWFAGFELADAAVFVRP